MYNNINHIDFIKKKKKVNYGHMLKPIEKNQESKGFLFYNNYDYLNPKNDLPKIKSNKSVLEKSNFYKDPLPSLIGNIKNTIYYKSKNVINRYRNISGNLEVGDSIGDRYEVKEKISRGAFGIVMSCFDHKNKEMVAIKCPARNDYNKLIKIEGEIYKKVGGDNSYIMNVKKFITDNNRNYLVMEKLDKNLYLWRKKYSPSINEVKSLTMQILKGVRYLHSKNIVHGDLKPENIVFSDKECENLKVADLGNSMYENELDRYSILQTRYYRAPEVILQTHKDRGIDIWSIGCIISELITGRPLFYGQTEEKQLFTIMEYLDVPPSYILSNSRVRNHYFNYYNNKPKNFYGNYIKTKSLNKIHNDNILIDLLNKIFKYDPKQRINIDQIINHNWFTK